MGLLVTAVIGVALLFGALMLFLEMGRRFALRRKRVDPDGAEKGFGAVEGAIFGLMGLLIAFTFSGAGERFQHRRDLILQEANDIGTAWMRIDLLPADAQPQMRQLFREYLDARLRLYQHAGDVDATREVWSEGAAIQAKIWQAAVAATHALETNAVSTLVLAPINDMFDIATTRGVATESHPPPIVYVMLVMLALLCALLAGYDMAESRTRNWLHIVGFALIMTITLYVIVDLEYPRLGFIRVDKADHVLMELRSSMD